MHPGGIFVDCNIHDIDLALWFLSPDPSSPLLVPKSISAVGVCAVRPELSKYNDVDNAVGTVEFWGGKIAYFYSSRMMASGQHDMTEIIGTKGKIVVNGNPATDLVEMWEADGIRREIPQTYWGRFREAFLMEGKEWVEACLERGKELPFELAGAVRAVGIAVALQESLVLGRRIDFDERGKRVERARL